jgi:hypothetical protein
VSRAGFTATPAKATSTTSLVDPANLLLEMSRKRKAEPDPFDEVHSPTKKQNTGDDNMVKEEVYL